MDFLVIEKSQENNLEYIKIRKNGILLIVDWADGEMPSQLSEMLDSNSHDTAQLADSIFDYVYKTHFRTQ